MGQVGRLRLDPAAVPARKAARLNAKKRAALKSQTVDLDLASSEMARLATAATDPTRRRSASRTHDHATAGGLARPPPEKRLYGPRMRPESADQVRGGRPGRAGA